MKYRAVPFALLVIIGCTASFPSPSSPPRQCCVDVTIRHDPAFTAFELESLLEAESVWHRGTYGAVCFTESKVARFELVIVRAETHVDLRPYDPGWEVDTGVYRNGTIVLLSAGSSRNTLTATAVHEIGHYLQLKHDDYHLDSIMHPNDGKLDQNNDLPELDRRTFFKIHSECR